MTSKAVGRDEPAAHGQAMLPGNIVSLNPSDGLFLRAEHLRVMQTYARELSMAVGIGAGTGVVYGFEVSLEETGTALHVLPGLAVNAAGQPLRASSSAVVALDDLPAVGQDGFWVIELQPQSRNFGTDSVYGNLCDEPCSGSGSAIEPWTAEGVKVSLRADDLPGLSGIVDSGQRRNWLASQYFERERKRGGPWTVPGENPIVAPIQAQDWITGRGAPGTLGVPIGVLQDFGGLTIDVWTARRDIGRPPADTTWLARLAMRPWNVFLAQVLQFQDQLSTMATDSVVVRREMFDPLRQHVEAFLERVKDTGMANWGIVKDLKTSKDAAEPFVLEFERPSLRQLGFDELPPAGFLPWAKGDDLIDSMEHLLGDRVDVRICRVRADYVAGAVEQARHLDRIPLSSTYRNAEVDILVPDNPADLDGLHTDNYGWVAFVRRREVLCGAAPVAMDPVDVYCVERDAERIEGTKTASDALSVARLTEEDRPVGQVSYPAGGWDYPGSESDLRTVDDAAARVRRNGGGITILAIASGDERLPLAALRGTLFTASLDGGLDPPKVWSIAPGGVVTEVIVVIQPKTQTPNG